MLRKNIIIMLAMISIAFVVGFIGKAGFVDKGLMDVDKVSDLDNMEVNFSSLTICGEDDIGSLKSAIDFYISELDKAELILIVEPTEDIKIEKNSLLQDVKVNKVIRGADIVGKEITIQANETFCYDSFELSICDDNGNEHKIKNDPRIYYSSSDNIMRSGNEYVVFVNENELNSYNDKEYYITLETHFSIICMSDTVQNKTLLDVGEKFYYSDYSKNAGFFDGVSVRYEDVKDLEFFTTSKEMLEELYYVKKVILEKYVLGCE